MQVGKVWPQNQQNPFKVIIYIARIIYSYICCLVVQMLPDWQEQYAKIFF